MKRHLLLVSLFANLPWAQSKTVQQPAPYRLTLQEAIQRGLQANLSVLVADTRVQEAQGTRVRSFSAALLPRVGGETYANLQNRNLQAFGISFPGIPKVVARFPIMTSAFTLSKTFWIFPAIGPSRRASAP
jgi:outer membrane protein TolC